MNKINILVLFAILTLLMTACEKDEPQTKPIDNHPADQYLPLAVGNYWVYDRYSADSNGVSYGGNVSTDSFWVEKDTVIENDTFYYVLSNAALGRLQIIGWSGNQLIDTSGRLLFDAIDLNSILTADTFYTQDTIIFYTLSTKVVQPTDSVTVPAGTFLTKNSQRTSIFNNPTRVRIDDTHYAYGVGKVKFHASFAATGDRMVWELKRYSLN